MRVVGECIIATGAASTLTIGAADVDGIVGFGATLRISGAVTVA